MSGAKDFKVVPVKHRPLEWGYVILDAAGKVVAQGITGTMGGPLIRKGAARTAGEQRLKTILKNEKRIARAMRKR